MKKGYRIGLGIALVILVTVIIIRYAPNISSTFQNLFSQSSYTKIKVVVGQVATYDQGDNHWGFIYRFFPTDPSNMFTVTSGFLTASFPTTQGKSYIVFGIEIKVSEAYSDYLVLLVKTT